MNLDSLTKPISVGKTIIGGTEANVLPFEPAGIDFTVLNKRQKSDPTYGHNQVPDAVVNSCSECCMQTIRGKPNLLGQIHRKLVNGCSQCPVGKAGDHIQARDGNGKKLFAQNPDGSLRPISQTEAMFLDIDGTD